MILSAQQHHPLPLARRVPAHRAVPVLSQGYRGRGECRPGPLEASQPLPAPLASTEDVVTECVVSPPLGQVCQGTALVTDWIVQLNLRI